jgi:predicted NAD/FAD-dependent oxidoreductase
MKSSIEPILIVGAGLSGLTAARALRRLGYKVIVFEESSVVGGRMATRTVNNGRFDSGAQFFTVREPRFAQLVDEWLAAGVAAMWSKGFSGMSGRTPLDGHPRFRGMRGMDSIPRYLAAGLDLRLNQRVESAAVDGAHWQLVLADGARVTGGALILTPPLPLSLRLLAAGGTNLPKTVQNRLASVKFAPCLALLAALEAPSKVPPPGGLQLHGEPIAFIGDNTQKGVSPEAFALTIHAGPLFSEEFWNSADEEVATLLLEAASYWIDAPVKRWLLERWRYSVPKEIIEERVLHLPGPPDLLFAGDAFGGPRIEGAALSGLAAVEALLNAS